MSMPLGYAHALHELLRIAPIQSPRLLWLIIDRTHFALQEAQEALASREPLVRTHALPFDLPLSYSKEGLYHTLLSLVPCYLSYP